jgi:2-polyprenyl-3-methyl-5-hydroxy-6-metoxy-1,4-benzoquinol methylase
MLDVVYNDGVRAQGAPECLLCRTLGQALYTGLRDEIGQASGIWDLRVCPACGLVWLDPRPLSEEIGKLYHGYYTHEPSDLWGWVPATWGIRRGRGAVLAAGFGYLDLVTGRASAAAGRILCRIGLLEDIVGGTVMWLHSSPCGRLLDVGCGGGHFLARMRSLGWRVQGVEPDVEAVRVARRSFDLNIHHGTFADVRFPGNEFDAVTLNHVIEHVLDPIGLLQECGRVLKAGGRVVAVTPNAQSLGRMQFGKTWRGWEPPRHLFLFTPKTLRTCAERAGLRIVTLRTTARLAPAIWMASSCLRTKQLTGRIRDGRLGWATQIWMRVMGLHEHFFGLRRAAGEEVVLVATKD